MHSHHQHRPSSTDLVAIAAMLVFVCCLFVALKADRDDGPPRCPVSHSGAVDMVPAGTRPCVLHGSGSGVASGSGPGYGSAPRPTLKAPAPKAPAKVPAAPKPAAPKAVSPARR